ncbi:MAG: NADP-dependent malic enzyme [Candidatus Methanoliparum thermophilum]|uniref:NADP-dependent malic enzyme n=1 Tax=Methanoliparum thermophilum TaxID=2491083 RepID=A0A520KS22_METT2|nr:NADP-dependent malic enzyme [Candidatus Methanoliparum sp. LAM-1]RZN64581.1 MAG: NADP-dependent malic enzyme [Candidatus Methanoliparum thermophilum]BDC35814.1 malate dehydrogenase [Candidatus Methanoliparum sp. LAM-1]
MDEDTVKKLLDKAKKPVEDSMRLHPYYKGKIEIVPKVPIKSSKDFSVWYTPGVAEPCRAINKEKELVYEYTNKWNNIAVVSDGTRVLGLGDIGPEAGLPVMEGKAMLFKYLGGVDAVPICLDTKDPDEIIKVCKWLQPSFGGINLEDIANPKCFYILDKMRDTFEIPVWHDDQQGTATVVLAGLINALELVGKRINDVKVVMVGAGAANIATERLITFAGINPENIIVLDSKGTLHPNREDLYIEKDKNPYKWNLCVTTNKEGIIGGISDALNGADVLISLSKPGPGVIKRKEIKCMNNDPIVFAMANPIPEIWPWEAKDAGARIVATGRSDFPNQINNSLGFPGIFRGVLDVRAKSITDEMCVAAAEGLAEVAREKGLTEDYIIPDMDEWDVYPKEAVAVGMTAMKQGVAKIKLTRDELYERAKEMIKRSRDTISLLMKSGIIKNIPEE